MYAWEIRRRSTTSRVRSGKITEGRIDDEEKDMSEIMSDVEPLRLDGGYRVRGLSRGLALPATVVATWRQEFELRKCGHQSGLGGFLWDYCLIINHALLM